MPNRFKEVLPLIVLYVHIIVWYSTKISSYVCTSIRITFCVEYFHFTFQLVSEIILRFPEETTNSVMPVGDKKINK
jgi:hypothetical protein